MTEIIQHNPQELNNLTTEIYLGAIIHYLGAHKIHTIEELLQRHDNNAEMAWREISCNPDAQQSIRTIISLLEQYQIRVVHRDSPEFPSQLKMLPNAPLALFIQGNISLLSSVAIAIVGTRKISEYGKRVTQQFGRDLASTGLTIISGLAYGVDSVAHQSCLDAGGKTVAVLGSGCSREALYPKAHAQLAAKIIESGGCIVSEYPPDMHAAQYTFPQRNRIIAGLAGATLITEADIKSGSIITGKLALEYGRDIFAVPGSIYSIQSRGTHYLIAQGAYPATSSQEIIERLGFVPKNIPGEVASIALSPVEQIIINNLTSTQEALHIDQIIANSRQPAQEIMTAVSMLEIQGLVTNLGGNRFVLK